jgi:hypothetical protein
MDDRLVAVHVLEAEAVFLDLDDIDILQVLMTVFVVKDKR